jgi:hypothetical protein
MFGRGPVRLSWAGWAAVTARGPGRSGRLARILSAVSMGRRASCSGPAAPPTEGTGAAAGPRVHGSLARNVVDVARIAGAMPVLLGAEVFVSPRPWS